jgi:putative PIN family toxin of toxin-antitoxin system
MKRHRIVLDTNVLVSAILFGGPPRDVLELAISGAIDCSLSLVILDELREVLCRPKFGFSLEQSLQVLEELHAVCDVIQPPDRVRVLASDPDDNMILECALASKADFIVSGDRHLLDLAKFRDVLIVRPSDYLKTIRTTIDTPTRKSSVFRDARRRRR